MPYTTVATNDVLTASHFNTNYRDQVTSTVTSATRPAGTEGQVIYETDTDRFYYYNGGWVELLKTGTWNTYTPVLTQSGAVTKTVSRASYLKIGRFVKVNLALAVTGAGTAANIVTASLPVTSVIGSNIPVGVGFLSDSGVGIYPGIVSLVSTTTAALLQSEVSAASYVGLAGFTAALAAGDILFMDFSYESAT